MLVTIDFVKKYKTLIYYLFAFYLTMGISSYTQLLYFQSNHHLQMFSLYYAVMAIAGALSFLITNRLNSYPVEKINRLFLVIYFVGMLLRIDDQHVVIVIFSAILCGVCASIILVTVRQWIYQLVDANSGEKGRIHSIRFFFMQLAGVISSALSGMLFVSLLKLGSANFSYRVILIFSALLMLFNMLIKLPNVTLPAKQSQSFFTLPENKMLAFSMYFIYIGLGISAAIVSSILPAIIHGKGWSVGNTSLIVSGITVLTLVTTYFYQTKFVVDHSKNIFLLVQIVTAIVSIIAVNIFDAHIAVIVIAVLTEMTLAGFFILKELLEYGIIPDDERTIYLGLFQSSFLIGDSLGSPIGSYLFVHQGLVALIWVYAVVSVIFASLFYLVLTTRKKTQ